MTVVARLGRRAPRGTFLELLRPRHPMLRAGYDLIVNVVVTAVLGVGFWILAARLYPAAEVGRDTVLVSAMLSLSAICQLNGSTVLMRFLPTTRIAPARFVGGAYAGVAGVSLLVAAGFVGLAPRLSDRFAFFGVERWVAVVFVAAVVIWGVFSLQDAVLTGLGRTAWIPLENGVFGLAKVALLPVMLLAGAQHPVFLAWVVAVAALVVPVNALIFGRVVGSRRPPAPRTSPVEQFGRGGLIRFGMHDLAGTILGHASSTMLPVIVSVWVSSAQTAYFFMPFTLVATFDLVFLSVASALTVAAAGAAQPLAQLTGLAVRRFAPLLAAGTLTMFIGAPLVLSLYGDSYAASGASVLQLLICASLFRAAIALYTAVCRVEGRGSRILVTQVCVFVLVLGFTAALAPRYGIEGVAVAWLAANGIIGIAVAPRLARLIRTTPVPASPEGGASCVPSA